LFAKPDPNQTEEGQDVLDNLNPHSLEIIPTAKLEPSLKDAAAYSGYQFERLGYFSVDPDTRPGKLVFNRTVALRDTWAKIEKREKSGR
jgi:glutaminyl-tRNA synthetase